MVFIVAASVSDEYHYAVMNNMNLIIVLELGLFSFCGVTGTEVGASLGAKTSGA